MASLNGILCVDKPQHFTSFDVIGKLRGVTKTRKIGHAGTLDPMATGVLPLLFGEATKAADLLPQSDKCYRAAFQLGVTTDTQDVWGKELSRSAEKVPAAALTAVLPSFRGKISQLPPMYSAVSVGGRRLYELARKGIEVERQPRTVEIKRLTLLSYDADSGSGEAEVCCSGGTYIRTLFHDIGEALGVGGIMTGLRRTEAAGFTLDGCLTLEEVERAAEEGTLAGLLKPVEAVFEPYPPCRLNEAQTRLFLNGVRLDLERLAKPPAGRCRVYAKDGAFLGLAEADWTARELRLKKFFRGGGEAS